MSWLQAPRGRFKRLIAPPPQCSQTPKIPPEIHVHFGCFYKGRAHYVRSEFYLGTLTSFLLIFNTLSFQGLIKSLETLTDEVSKEKLEVLTESSQNLGEIATMATLTT